MFDANICGFFIRGVPITEEMDVAECEVIGEIPRQLSGAYMRNGSNQQFEPRGDYHLFDGDGMIHAVHLQDGKASFREGLARKDIAWMNDAGQISVTFRSGETTEAAHYADQVITIDYIQDHAGTLELVTPARKSRPNHMPPKK